MNTGELFYLALIFGLGAIFGLVISYFSKSSKKAKTSNWKLKYEEANSNYIDANKSYKAEKKRINQLIQQRDNWKAKHEKVAPIPDQLKAEIKTHKDQLRANTDTIDSLNSEIKRLSSINEKLKSDLEKLKEKYATDMHDSRNWKSKRSSLQTEIETLSGKVRRLETDKKDLRAQVSLNTKKLDDYEVLKRNHRRLNKEQIRLKKDLEYWENKHYEAHHELSTSMETIKVQRDQLKDFKLKMQGEKLKQEQMMKQIGEFKTKFLDAKERYTALMKP